MVLGDLGALQARTRPLGARGRAFARVCVGRDRKEAGYVDIDSYYYSSWAVIGGLAISNLISYFWCYWAGI